MLKSSHMVMIGIIIVLYSNFITGLLVTHVTAQANFVPVLKDLFIITLLLYVSFCILKRQNTNIRFPALCLVYISILFIYFLLSEDGYFNRIYNFRRIVLPIVVFLIFLNLNINTSRNSNYLKFIKANFILMAAFGLVEYFSEPTFFWKRFIDINKYWASSSSGDGGMIDFFEHGGRLYTSDSIAFLGYKIRRMVSFSLEPTTFAAFMLFCFTIFLYGKDKMFATLAMLCGLLTFSKLFILGTLIVFMQMLFKKYHPTYIVIGTLLLFLISKEIYVSTGKLHGAFSHVKGFYTGIELLNEHPFGFGMGIAGNRGSEEISTINGEFGGESGLGNLTAQIGYAGLLYLVFILYLSMKFYIPGKKGHRNSRVSCALIYQYLLNFYLSASSMGVLSFYFIFMHLGLTLRKQ